MAAYYNEIDPYAAEWLRNLIKAGHLPAGDVDERSIEDVRPDDLKPYIQCHFFAGIGIWPAAIRAAGWPDDRPVWTGSCPCQPFSQAGKGEGFADERHLWPAFNHLIQECRPVLVLGEQVAGQDGLGWLDLVQADMEANEYAFGAVVAPAAGFGMEWQGGQSDEWIRWAIRTCADPMVAAALRDFADWACANLSEGEFHKRERLYWCAAVVGLADNGCARPQGRFLGGQDSGRGVVDGRSGLCGAAGIVADAPGQQCGERRLGTESVQSRPVERSPRQCAPEQLGDAPVSGRGLSGLTELSAGDAHEACKTESLDDASGARPDGKVHHAEGYSGQQGRVRLLESGCANGGLPDASDGQFSEPQRRSQGRDGQRSDCPNDDGSQGRSGEDHGERDAIDWLFCRDECWRPVRSGTFPLVNGASARMGRLRAYGNGIHYRQATHFVMAADDAARLVWGLGQ